MKTALSLALKQDEGSGKPRLGTEKGSQKYNKIFEYKYGVHKVGCNEPCILRKNYMRMLYVDRDRVTRQGIESNENLFDDHRDRNRESDEIVIFWFYVLEKYRPG